jgi:hypothetical protein
VQTRYCVEGEEHVHVACLNRILAVQGSGAGGGGVGRACGGQLGVLVVRVAMGERDVWVWEMDMVVGFRFRDSCCRRALAAHFGRAVLVVGAYWEGG